MHRKEEDRSNINKQLKFLTIGFTLLELVIVLAILAIGLVTLLIVIRNASINNAIVHHITVGGELAEAKLENIIGDKRKRGFDYIKEENYPTEDPVVGFSGYSREVDIYYVELSDLNNQAGHQTDYKRIEVIVTSKAGTTPSVRVVTIVSNIVPSS